MEIKKVGVVGLGIMGADIAQTIASSHYQTFISDASPEIAQNAYDGIKNRLRKLSRKGKIAESEMEGTLKQLVVCQNIENMRDCDLVIEAISENLELKRNIFLELDRVKKQDQIFASNTSTLAISDICSGLKNQAHFIGLHFFNPAVIMKLVEVIKTPVTDQEVVAIVDQFVISIGKEPVIVSDRGGFLVNRMLTPFLFDAMRMLDSGAGSVEDIDKAMVLGCGHPVGPLKLADLIGLDVLSDGTLYFEMKEKRYAPPTILRRFVALGLYGKKSGLGFYDWSDAKNPIPRIDIL